MILAEAVNKQGKTMCAQEEAFEYDALSVVLTLAKKHFPDSYRTFTFKCTTVK